MEEPPEGYQVNQNGGIYRSGAAHSPEVRRNFLRDYQHRSSAIAALCVTHGVSEATGYRWISEYNTLNKVDSLPRGGSDPWVYTEDNLWFLSHLLVSLAPHQRTTGAEIARHLAASSNNTISWTAAQCRTAMKKLDYSKKHFTSIAKQRYYPWTILRNAQFMEFRLQVPPEHLAFFDESGWELDITGNPTSGWGSRFDRIYNVTYKKMKGVHHNLPLLASVNSVLHWEFTKGSFKAANVVEFFEHASIVLKSSKIRYIQMDNARIHSEKVVEMIRSLVNADGIHLDVLFQPTYSPHLNPVELIFGYLKQTATHHYEEMRLYPEIILNDIIYNIPKGTLEKFAYHSEVY